MASDDYGDGDVDHSVGIQFCSNQKFNGFLFSLSFVIMGSFKLHFTVVGPKIYDLEFPSRRTDTFQYVKAASTRAHYWL